MTVTQQERTYIALSLRLRAALAGELFHFRYSPQAKISVDGDEQCESNTKYLHVQTSFEIYVRAAAVDKQE